MEHRHLTAQEIETLKSRGCRAADWDKVLVKGGIDYIENVSFSGEVRLGKMEKTFTLPGGV